MLMIICIIIFAAVVVCIAVCFGIINEKDLEQELHALGGTAAGQKKKSKGELFDRMEHEKEQQQKEVGAAGTCAYNPAITWKVTAHRTLTFEGTGKLEGQFIYGQRGTTFVNNCFGKRHTSDTWFEYARIADGITEVSGNAFDAMGTIICEGSNTELKDIECYVNISAPAGSKAEAYAKTHGNRFVPLSELNQEKLPQTTEQEQNVSGGDEQAAQNVTVQPAQNNQPDEPKQDDAATELERMLPSMENGGSALILEILTSDPKQLQNAIRHADAQEQDKLIKALDDSMEHSDEENREILQAVHNFTEAQRASVQQPEGRCISDL